MNIFGYVNVEDRRSEWVRTFVLKRGKINGRLYWEYLSSSSKAPAGYVHLKRLERADLCGTPISCEMAVFFEEDDLNAS